MDLGKKIMTMRNEKNLSQEQLAEKLNVTRKFFNVSLDVLLSYDDKVLDYLKDSTDIVKSNKNILYAVLLNILLIIAFIIVGIIFNESASIIIIIFTVSIISFSFLFYQIIKKI